MIITEFDKLVDKGKKKKDPSMIIKTMNHCYDGCGWNTCDFWWYDKKDRSRCAMFGDAVKFKSESLKICHEIYGHYYNGYA